MSKQSMIEEVAREILIKTKRKIFSHNIGNNPTAFVGNGLDFSELREYYFGDDVRKINWKATAKEQRPYINLFTEERELNIVIAFMSSGSIAFGSQRIKQELMAEITALLGFSAMKNSDNVTTIAFDTQEAYFRKPTKSINALHEIIPALLALDPLGKEVDYAKFSEYLLGRIKQKSIIFIVGDFFEPLDLSLLAAKHEVYAIMVRDRFEEAPTFEDSLDLIDPNSLEHHSFEFDAGMLRAYQAQIQAQDQQHHEHFLGHKIRHSKIYTDEDPFYKLNNLVR